MAEFKVVLNDPKTGKSKQIEVKDAQAKPLLNLKIGDMVKGEMLDLQGYEFEIKGGSDSCGFPLRKGIPTARKKILTLGGVGFKNKIQSGIRKRKTVCGEKITENTKQINMVVKKAGKQPLFEEAKAEEKKEEQ